MRRHYWILLGLLLVAFAVRLAYWERSASFGQYELSYDDDEYYKAGVLFARGEFFRDPYPLRYTRSPGFPLAFAPLLAAFGPHLEIVLAFQVCVSVLSVALVYALARRAFGKNAGLWAAALMAISPNYASLAGSFLLTETLFAFCALLLIYLFWRWTDAGMSLGQALLLGVLFGYMALIRGQALYFFALAVLWYAYAVWKRKQFSVRQFIPMLVALCGVALVIAPWTWRNAVVYQRFILLDTNSGWTVWRDHRTPNDDFWETLPRIPNPGDRSQYAVARGAQNILADPFHQIIVQGTANLLALPRLELDAFARGGGYLSDVIADAPTLWLALVNDLFFIGVLILAVAGFLVAAPRVPGLLVLWLVLNLAIFFFFHTQSRFRAHYLFVLILFASAALAQGFALWKNLARSARAGWVGAAILILMLAYSPLLLPLFQSEYYLAQAQGRDIAAAQNAVNVFPEYAPAHDALGDAYRRAGDFDNALKAYDAALKINPFEMQARLGRMDIFRQQGDSKRLEREVRAAGVDTGELELPAPLWWSFDPAPTRLVELGDSTSSFGYILNFYAIQPDGEEKMRFTRARSFVKFPGVTGWEPSKLVFYARAVPVPNQPLPEVDVRLNGRDAAHIPLTVKWQDHEIPLDDSIRANDTLVVEFRSPTFRPSDVFEGSNDTRDLGFMLGYVELR
jgi:4-amino-4-deoxy-L-arabinose transferase-like glycosyltransferase